MQQVNTVRYQYSINHLMSHLLEYQHQYKVTYLHQGYIELYLIWHKLLKKYNLL